MTKPQRDPTSLWATIAIFFLLAVRAGFNFSNIPLGFWLAFGALAIFALVRARLWE
jgi:hypothetical protein